MPCHKMIGDPFHDDQYHHVPEEHGVVGEPGSSEHGWLKSGVNKACGPTDIADAFCAGCSLGGCSSLVEAQACCLEADDCKAVYGGGEHWWTYSHECVEQDHPNFYNVYHRGPGAVALPPADAPPGHQRVEFASLLATGAGSPVLNTFNGPITGFQAAEGPDPLVHLRNPADGCIDATLQQIVPVELRWAMPCHKMIGDPFHDDQYHHVPEEHGVVGEPGSSEHGWLKSGVNKACGPTDIADAFCAGCSLGGCSSLVEAQACCLEADDCKAVYGGGEHWWTYSHECVEHDHPNFYNVYHRGPGAVALPPADAPPGHQRVEFSQ